MADAMGRPPSGMGRTLLIAIVVSLIIGAGAGFGAGSLAAPKAVHHPVESRVFWVFTVVLPFNESEAGLPHDYFAPDRITVYQGDNVTIHFFNTEDAPEDHTFTMEAPYTINRVLPYNATTSFSFTASTAGIFAFRCAYHQPTMTGWLVVLDN